MYDFDEIIDRQGTNALNTDGFRGYIFHAGPEKVSFSWTMKILNVSTPIHDPDGP